MNKKWLKPIVTIAVIVIIIAAGIGGVAYYLSIQSVVPSMTDIMDTVMTCIPQIAAMIAAVILIIAGSFLTVKLSKSKGFFAFAQSVLIGLLIIVFAVNSVCFGPCYSALSLVLSDVTAVSDELLREGADLNVRISEEGITLIKNENNTLPLAGTANLNVFGWASIDPIYGGSGSGAGDAGADTVDLLKGLENGGFTINTELKDFYKEYCEARPTVGMSTQDWTLPEPDASLYSDELIAQAQAFSDTAVIVIGRMGGENADMPADTYALEHGTFYSSSSSYQSDMNAGDDWAEGDTYLNLSNQEKSMVEMVCSNFDQVVVLINSANPMELGWLDDYDSIQSALVVPGTGVNGFNALGSILNGSVNPSGHLVDTYVYDLTAAPYFNNIGNFEYLNAESLLYTGDTSASVGGAGSGMNESYYFVNYVEGIYVGYKFYETADIEGLIKYDDVVQYPFGYGLSYTTFEQSITDVQADGKTVALTVNVKNTGAAAGVSAVEVYYTPPYTNGGIEKASVNLVEFEKTEMLEPGAETSVTISFDYEDMASYDDNGIKAVGGAYVLEAGSYDITIRSDSHTVLDSRVITVDRDYIYNDSNDGARDADNLAAVNTFDYAKGSVEYLSRKDSFANYDQATASPAADLYYLTEEQLSNFVNMETWKPEDHDDANDVMPVTEAKHGLTIYDMAGVAYDDPKWDELLDQMSVSEMAKLVGIGGYSTAEVASINLPGTVQTDGPSILNGNMTASGNGGTSFCCDTMIASTWNKKLANERGTMMGRQARELEFSGWYGPGANTHRSAFGGRNFEYYSEDSVLAGYICASETKGAAEQGLLAYMKHFALNDQEANRDRGLCTWSNEQAIREIYLRAFELPVRDGEAMATMTSFNFIGNKWAGGSSELLTTVLRGEWGFEGVVVTDWYNGYSSGYMDSNLATRTGGDQMLSLTGTGGAVITDTSATAVTALRNSCHNILFGLTRTNLMERENTASTWVTVFHAVDIILALLLIGLEVCVILRYRKLRKEESDK